VTRHRLADDEMVPVEYYCPVHGTVVVEYHTPPDPVRPSIKWE
jgi:hypothetical protein